MTNPKNKICNPIILFIKNNYSHLNVEFILSEFNNLNGKDIIDENDKAKIYDYESLQNFLSDFNENSSIKKEKGVYYTPSDVCDFINTNAIKLWLNCLNTDEYDGFDFSKIPYNKICFQCNVLDPTCGSGEFLLSVAKLKLRILKTQKDNITSNDVAKVAKTIFGNDIDLVSTFICKARLFLLLLKFISELKIKFPKNLSAILNSNFTNNDYIEKTIDSSSYDLIVGNPPYVEDSKYYLTNKTLGKYGNVYANVLKNSSINLKQNGVMGFIIPLSYVSTLRMKKIREELNDVLAEQHILSFNDRPDCLFTNVHQKLCILIGKKINSASKTIYTSDYYYWYKEERPFLFDKANVIKNNFVNSDYIPKIGNIIENSIYKKVTCDSNKSLLSYLSSKGTNKIYLNSRATFWIKAFRHNHNFQKSYSQYECKDRDCAVLAFCILNSSLFWWFWVVVSDCWHITNKELLAFKIPDINTLVLSKLTKAAINLEKKLEETKIYVATKQTDYEYKHRDCIKEIQIIDALINDIFSLTKQESDFIKSFAFRYRISGGNNR